MKPKNLIRNISLVGALLIYILVFSSCSRSNRDKYQGYVEGEFVYIACPFSGQLTTLNVHKGDLVQAQNILFTLDDTLEKTSRDQAQERYNQARANLNDLLKGKRPSEISSLIAQLNQAQASLDLSSKNYLRISKLGETNVVSQQIVDEAFSRKQQDLQHVNQLKADLNTAGLGSREDQKHAAENELRARKAALIQAEWKLSQKKQKAPKDSLIFDILFREGEWVQAGQPVISLLPPENIKVRTFIPESVLAKIQTGYSARIYLDGLPTPIEGIVSYISTQAEYTPPVIYSRESRTKLVYMVELSFNPEKAKELHPGQPVDVQF